ncbi:MtrB/PioB family outer membrane beta-barrel protein [Ferribacterium limneticum]|uniref:MtrB/PioB family outer membrane beta-barrel protein n=1 Tax=Ferribacterium limneticum TaxID=76259 RepID=UPI001CFA37E2|nr:MtrB/PioB family outer membrane beta-barrel protein [Ferribacterium limneticum]UCV18813.1 MtrB/PioB family outer membrane beta-barrel protein [Ferribacterium limneticum]
MHAKTQKKILALTVAGLFASPLYAAEAAAEGMVVTGDVTAKFFAFDYFKGADAGRTQFLERYNYQKGIGDDNRSGAYLDLDLDIVANNGQRNVFVLKRDSFGEHNQRNIFKANTDLFGLAGYYTNFRSSSGGLSFLYSPGQIPSGGVDTTYAAASQTGFVRQFNNDSLGQNIFKVDRQTYGIGVDLKPELLGNKLSASLEYDGYARDGNRFATYVLGNGDLTGGNANKRPLRWRGFDAPIDEKMNRYTFSLNGSPGGFNLGYEGRLEKFESSRNFTIGDFGAQITAQDATVAPTNAAVARRPIQYAPDSTLISNNFRLAKRFGATSVAAGYGLSVLDQDSFSQQQQFVGYSTGKITTNSAYASVSSNIISGVGLDGFIRYNHRKNNSDFPVAGLITPTATEGLDVRINQIEALSYGISATMRPGFLKSTATLGWKHEDKDRDLTWSQWGGGVVSINQAQTLYRNNTRVDELFLKWVARPMQGLILRVTPSYALANSTGLVTEPERALNLKTQLSYTTTKGIQTSGYYNYKRAENGNNAFTSSAAGGALGASVQQETEKTLQSAGVSVNVPISEWINTYASFSWLQDDFSSYLMRNDARRYDAPTAAINFLAIDRPNYKIDSYVVSLGGDWQVSDPLRLNAGYTWTQSKGDTASGYVGTQLAAGNSIDGVINNNVHTLTLGVDYELKKRMKLRGTYVYDYYTDNAYTALTGAYQGLMVGVSLGF